MTSKQCNRCELVLPLEQFSLHTKGKRRGHCKDCQREEQRLDRERYKSRLKVDWILRNGRRKESNVDPVVFSRAVCEHVSLYVERAIKRWEYATEMEAPPHVAALRQISTSFVKEHPERRCGRCGEMLAKGAASQRRYCAPCAQERNRESTREANKRERERLRKQARRVQNKQDLQERRELARLLRAQGLKWREIAERTGMASTGAAYNLVHWEEFNARMYHRRKKSTENTSNGSADQKSSPPRRKVRERQEV